MQELYRQSEEGMVCMARAQFVESHDSISTPFVKNVLLTIWLRRQYYYFQ